jgi:hypothetical protein
MSIPGPLFYISTLSGLQIELNYSPSLSIRSIKKEVEAALGCPSNIQLYSFQGLMLRNEDQLGKLGVKEGDKVQVLMRNPLLFQVFVHFNEQIYTLDVLHDETIESVITCLRKVVKANLTGSFLCKPPDYLTDPSRTLSQAGVQPLDELYLTYVS